jgi:hypothetical protein
MVMRSQATDWGVRPNARENGQITPEKRENSHWFDGSYGEIPD